MKWCWHFVIFAWCSLATVIAADDVQAPILVQKTQAFVEALRDRTMTTYQPPYDVVPACNRVLVLIPQLWRAIQNVPDNIRLKKSYLWMLEKMVCVRAAEPSLESMQPRHFRTLQKCIYAFAERIPYFCNPVYTQLRADLHELCANLVEVVFVPEHIKPTSLSDRMLDLLIYQPYAWAQDNPLLATIIAVGAGLITWEVVGAELAKHGKADGKKWYVRPLHALLYDHPPQKTSGKPPTDLRDFTQTEGCVESKEKKIKATYMHYIGPIRSEAPEHRLIPETDRPVVRHNEKEMSKEITIFPHIRRQLRGLSQSVRDGHGLDCALYALFHCLYLSDNKAHELITPAAREECDDAINAARLLLNQFNMQNTYLFKEELDKLLKDHRSIFCRLDNKVVILEEYTLKTLFKGDVQWHATFLLNEASLSIRNYRCGVPQVVALRIGSEKSVGHWIAVRLVPPCGNRQAEMTAINSMNGNILNDSALDWLYYYYNDAPIPESAPAPVPL